MVLSYKAEAHSNGLPCKVLFLNHDFNRRTKYVVVFQTRHLGSAILCLFKKLVPAFLAYIYLLKQFY